MATAAEKQGFRPVHEAHAIEQLVATVQFEQPLADDAIRAAMDVMSRFNDVLPGRNEIRGMGFQIGPQGVTPIASRISGVPDGIVRTFSDGRGVVVKELRLDRQSLVFRTLTYTRWDAVWGEARRYFEVLLPIFGGINIAAYALSYVDKFIWTGSLEKCRPIALLKPSSPYISPASFEATDLWHCHFGRFVAAGEQTKRLEVVDFDCIDEADALGATQEAVRVVRISTTVTDFFNQPGFSAYLLPADESMPQLDRAFSALHSLLKDVFGAIVGDEAAIQVGLNNAG